MENRLATTMKLADNNWKCAQNLTLGVWGPKLPSETFNLMNPEKKIELFYIGGV